MEDMKLTHAREFTDIEDSVLDIWLELENAGLESEARAVLDTGLMWEHYTSLLDNDPDKRAMHEIVNAAALATKFNAAVAVGQQAMRSRGLGSRTPLASTFATDRS